MDARIPIPYERIEAFCRRWHVVEFALYGSVLRDDFGPASDVDVLVQFSPEARPGLFDMVRMQDELEDLLGRRVDLSTRRGVESSQNPIRRKAILDSAAIIYAA